MNRNTSNNRIAELENALTVAKMQREKNELAMAKQKMEEQAMEIQRLQMVQRTSLMAAERIRNETRLSQSQPLSSASSTMSGSVYRAAMVQQRPQWNTCTAVNSASTAFKNTRVSQSQPPVISADRDRPRLTLTATEQLQQSLASNPKLQRALNATQQVGMPIQHVGSKRRLPQSFSLEGLEELQSGHQVKRHKGNNLPSKGRGQN